METNHVYFPEQEIFKRKKRQEKKYERFGEIIPSAIKKCAHFRF